MTSCGVCLCWSFERIQVTVLSTDPKSASNFLYSQWFLTTEEWAVVEQKRFLHTECPKTTMFLSLAVGQDDAASCVDVPPTSSSNIILPPGILAWHWPDFELAQLSDWGINETHWSKWCTSGQSLCTLTGIHSRSSLFYFLSDDICIKS